jgi:hypothetical protein
VTRYISGQEAEHRAAERLARYAARRGPVTQPPVPLERLIDDEFDLRVLWVPFDSPTLLQPLAGLQPSERRILVNERRRDWFERYPGTLSFTLAHELGHWDLHVDHAALGHPVFDGFEPAATVLQFRTPRGVVDVLLSKLQAAGLSNEERYEALRGLTADVDGFFEARQVNRYAGALLMPEELLASAIAGRDILDRDVLRELARSFDVSLRALTIRLDGLGRLYCAPDGSLHASRAAHAGQGSLF